MVGILFVKLDSRILEELGDVKRDLSFRPGLFFIFCGLGRVLLNLNRAAMFEEELEDLKRVLLNARNSFRRFLADISDF